MNSTRSFFGTIAAVGWSFIGLRRKKDFDVDADGNINPLYLIVAAAIGLAVFIGMLILAVKLAVPTK
jgi:hypothetical protein